METLFFIVFKNLPLFHPIVLSKIWMAAFKEGGCFVHFIFLPKLVLNK